MATSYYTFKIGKDNYIKLLGHSRIETTMEYVTTSINSIKNNHQKLII